MTSTLPQDWDASQGGGVVPRVLGSFVTPEWLEASLNDPNLRIVQLDGESYYGRFHISRASQIAFNRLVVTRDEVPGLRADPQDLAQEFGRLGIQNNSAVVAYDLTGGLDAARFIWTLASLGHTGMLAVLDGGLSTWYSQDRPMESQAHVVAEEFYEWSLNPEWEAEVERVQELSRGEIPGILIDTRTRREYMGQSMRHPRGHIAHALHFDWTESLAGPKDPRLKDLKLIRERFAQMGITDLNQELVVYCETGHRAAQTWLLLCHLGFEKVRLYDGSMAQWRKLGLPVVMPG